MAAQLLPQLSADEYLVTERASPIKHEFFASRMCGTPGFLVMRSTWLFAFALSYTRRSEIVNGGGTRPLRLLLGVLLPAALLADSITVTISNQTIQSSASASVVGAQDCTNAGTISASCYTSGTFNGYMTYSDAAASLTGSQMTVSVNTNPAGTASSYVKFSEDVLITGGSGTGYIDIAFGVRNVGQNIYTGGININGGEFTQGAETDWDVAPFTFGQAFNYSVDLGVIGGPFDYYLSQLTFEGARVFTEKPTGCNSYSGLCDGPSFTDVSNALASPIPEPNTFLIILGPLAFVLWNCLCRRRPNPNLVVGSIEPTGISTSILRF